MFASNFINSGTDSSSPASFSCLDALRMRKAAAKGFINATDGADYLVKKGMPFRDAYGVIGKLVNYAIQNDKTLETLTLEETFHSSINSSISELSISSTYVNFESTLIRR